MVEPAEGIVPRPRSRRGLAVLRIFHSGVVDGWRQRERALIAEGVDVTLVCPRRWNEGGAVVPLGPDHEPWVVPARTFGRHPYGFVYNPWPLARLLWARPFDVIDVHEEPASLAALEVRILAWFRHRRTPMVFYGAQNLLKRYPPPFRWIERGSLRRAGGVYPCNHAAGEIFVRKGFRGLVHPIGLGVDPPPPDDGEDRVPRRSTGFVVGYAGRLEEHKGVQVVLEALSHVPADVRFEVAGDGPFGDDLRAQVTRLDLQERVRFRGFVPHAAVASFLRTCDVVVVPSQVRANWVEQFGRTAVEVMAAGVPLVVSDSGSLPEIVSDAAVVVPAADVAGWAAAIAALATDAPARAELAERGRRRARQFEWPAVARELADLYVEVVGS